MDKFIEFTRKSVEVKEEHIEVQLTIKVNGDDIKLGENLLESFTSFEEEFNKKFDEAVQEKVQEHANT